MELTQAIQEGLISLLLFDEKAAVQVASLVETKWYDTFYKTIAEDAKRYLERYKRPAGEHAIDLFDAIRERFPKEEDVYDKLFSSLQNLKGTINSEYMLARATSFVRSQSLRRVMAAALKLGQKADDESLAQVETLFGDWLKTTHSNMDDALEFKDPEQSLAWYYKEDSDVFPTGIKALDDLDQGPGRKQLHMFLAPFGAGKSWWLLNLAKQSTKIGKKVLYLTLEMSKDEVAQRFHQMLFSVSKRGNKVERAYFDRDEFGELIGIDTREIKRPSFKDPKIDKLLTKKLKQTRVNFLIQEYPTGQMTIGIMKAMLDRLESTRGFVPDLILVDYADLFSTDPNNLRQSVGKVYIDLRGLAIERNVAVATCSQVNRVGIGKKLITHNDSAEDASKAGTVDKVITHNQTQAEKERGVARLFVSKGRQDADKYVVVISQCYAIGQFVLDEIGFAKAYWDEFDNSTEGT